ncbi:MAG: hypothetical protein ACFFA4_02460 [Promethearchaeota archaeon]
MDTSSDFIQPEFLNIIFFQQKNLVVFPYVDLKHLHGLEIFTTGYNVVDLESTAFHNLKEILEFESDNSYSQNPTLYFIYNIDRERLKEIMQMESIRCIINSNENVSNLANGSKFIFFNKKNNQFLNYNSTASELEFENLLINNSQDEHILQENIHKIKMSATRIFKELNQSGKLETLPDILGEYDKNYWNTILDFTSRYYDINIPDTSGITSKSQKNLNDFSKEYEVLISTNQALGKEFIQLLHEFRSKRVNSAHLELEELYNPLKLFNYLRNHHWKEGIPKDFVEEWREMNISKYHLTESDQIDFETILEKLGLEIKAMTLSPNVALLPEFEEDSLSLVMPLPSKDWNIYKNWIMAQLTALDQLILSIPRTSNVNSYMLKELSELINLLKINKKDIISRVPHNDEIIPGAIKLEIMTQMQKMRIGDWVELFGVQNKIDFIIDFFRQFSNFHDEVFGIDRSKKIEMPIKIKKFSFPSNLERKLLWFNHFRNKIVHGKMSREQTKMALKNNEPRINSTFLQFLAYLIKKQVHFLAKNYNLANYSKIKDIIMLKYLKNHIFSQKEIKKICEYLE